MCHKMELVLIIIMIKLARYLMETYSSYCGFLDSSASQEVDSFLKSGEQELSFFAKV